MNDQKTIEKKPVSLVRRIAWIVTIIAAIVLALVVAFVVTENLAKDEAARKFSQEMDQKRVMSAKPEYTDSGALRIYAADLLIRVQADKQAAQTLLNQSTIEMHGNLTVENPVGLNGSSLNFQTNTRAIPILANIDTASQAKAAKLEGANIVTVRCRASNVLAAQPMVGPCDIIEN
jgi:tRNA_anti-like